jgi:hypothetical protein
MAGRAATPSRISWAFFQLLSNVTVTGISFQM